MSASAEDILAASEAGARGGNVVFCVGSVLRAWRTTPWPAGGR